MTQTRRFPSCTTEELKIAVIDYQMGIHPCGPAAAGHIEALIAEVLAREAGVSKANITPQASWAGVTIRRATI